MQTYWSNVKPKEEYLLYNMQVCFFNFILCHINMYVDIMFNM